ncbi:MAG: molybdopterin-dependent oxidoreductase [Chloroflexi bacterium]|nr:molybdopterin-dependent oxidoreductase [Chloroflexota bacterium]MBU1749253.1 molybdopterin-dependent oxidoreductase [Chloroflexota bacterium]
MATVTLTIDGKRVETPEDSTVLEAALTNGIYIPHLCYLERLRPYAGCRLCLVEIEGYRKKGKLPTSCTEPVREGMVVWTNTPKVIQRRRDVLELLLSDHPARCLTCPRPVRCPPFSACQRDPVVTDRCVICAKNERCELQEVCDYVGVYQQRFYGVRKEFPLERTNPFIERDWSKCISCGRCVRACVEIRGVGAIEFAYRGKSMTITTPFEDEMKDTNCEFCGQCVTVCPTGALMERVNKYVGYPDHTVPTICTYCGVGCNIRIDLLGTQIVGISTRDPQNPVNRDNLCVKGHFAYDFIQSSARLTTPLIRRPSGAPRKAKWDEALNLVASRLADIRAKHGPEAIGIVTSAKCTNEEIYLSQKFARAVIGTNSVDQCAQLCHTPTLEALTRAFGSAAMTTSIQQVEKAGCIFVIGSNTTETHPIVALRIKWAVQKGAKLIVANPREIDLCRFAHIWLRLNPGTDVALINGLLRVILDEELWDAQFVGERCSGFYPLAMALQQYPVEKAAEITGVPAEDMVMAARLIATGGRDERYMMPPVYYGPLAEVGTHGDTDGTCILYGTGLTHNYHANEAVQALADLALVTGSLGREGAGLCPLAGQNNVQGACDMGALPNQLPGYQSPADLAMRQKFEDAWGVPLPTKPGLNLLEMLEEAKERNLKALYIIGANPMLSAPDLTHVRESLESLEFLVVQDIFYSETAQLADVVLPAASFAETDGTFTNTERRVQRVRAAVPAPGEARTDWQILSALAQHPRLRRETVARPKLPTQLDFSGWDYTHPAAIMSEINRLVPQYGGITYDRLESEGLQWPCPHLNHPGTEILYTEGFDQDKGQLVAVDYAPPLEQADKEYPLILTTGRILFHYHTGRMTMRSMGLVKIRPEGFIEIHPDDAAALSIADGDTVRVTSRRGNVLIRAKTTDHSPPGLVFMSFHYSESAVNLLTGRSPDPTTRMPDLKYCAVRVERVNENELGRAEQRKPTKKQSK